MWSRFIRYCALAAVLVAALMRPPVSHADGVVYKFTDAGGSIGAWSWSFAAPTFITSNTSVGVSDLLSVTTPPGYTIYGAAILSPSSSSFTVETFFHTPDPLIMYTPFDSGPIDHFGIYKVGTATTTYWSLEVSPAPEPDGVLLLGSGFAALAGLRKKLRR